jgi:multidrug efflux system membrane fusion protein
MYVYFDVVERTLLRVRRGINTGAIQVPADRTEIPVFIGLEGEEGYPHRGTLDFINNAFTPSTATILGRALFDNHNPAQTYRIAQVVATLDLTSPRAGAAMVSVPVAIGVAMQPPRAGRRLLSPGMFVRVRVPIGQPHPALLVIDKAVGFDQGLRFVYVVDAQNMVQYRRVTTGPLQDDGLRVIEEGLKPDEWVVIGGLQQVRPRMEVDPERMPMPTMPFGEQAPAAVPVKPQPPPWGGSTR